MECASSKAISLEGKFTITLAYPYYLGIRNGGNVRGHTSVEGSRDTDGLCFRNGPVNTIVESFAIV